MGIPLKTRLLEAARVLLRPSVKSGHVLGDDDGEGVPAESACPADRVERLDRCPMCGDPARTRVGEFNKFIYFARPPDEEAPRADYSLCHRCGVLYAARRPAGPRYRWFLTHFEESLGRAGAGERRAGKIAISSNALTEDDRARMKRLVSHGAFVSLDAGLTRKEYLPALFDDRMAASPHVEILGSLLELKGRRVLEVRSRLGSIPAALRRLFDADVSAMAIFEGQRFLIGEAYGIPAAPIDFDRFEIPFAPPFDLIVCNHMLTHAVHPRDLLATVREHLAPGGHAYFYNEPHDAEILADGKSMFSTLNVFHLQTFDPPSMARGLAANGFRVKYQTVLDGHVICLAQRADAGAAADPMPAATRDERIARYRQARDAAMLMLPERSRGLVEEGWDALVRRALDTGVAEFRPDGRIAVKQRPPGRRQSWQGS